MYFKPKYRWWKIVAPLQKNDFFLPYPNKIEYYSKSSYLSLLTIWNPNSDSKGSLIWSTFNEKATSSNAFTIIPFVNSPKLPPDWPEGQFECCTAESTKLTFPLFIFVCISSIFFFASYKTSSRVYSTRKVCHANTYWRLYDFLCQFSSTKFKRVVIWNCWEKRHLVRMWS